MEVITSKSNEKVKLIKSLNEKKFRQKNRCFYLEGIKVVNEVLQSDKAVDIMFIALCREILEHINGGKECIEKMSALSNIPIYEVKKEIFINMVDTKAPQGILVVLKQKEKKLEELLQEIQEDIHLKNKNIVLLDRIQDAGNLGTIIRTADAFGISTILCLEGTTDVYSPKVLRSTMGSILRQSVIYIQKEQMKQLKKYGYQIVGTSLNTDQDIKKLNFNKKSVFVFGNEANGMEKEVEKMCDELIKIKMSGHAESLNVGVATGIVLYLQDNLS